MPRLALVLATLTLAGCGADDSATENEHGPAQGVRTHESTTTSTTPQNLHSPDTDLGHPEDDGG